MHNANYAARLMNMDDPSLKRLIFSVLVVILFSIAASAQPTTKPSSMSAGNSLTRIDRDGVIRWVSDGREVALFGANYCLPSACDYRAAGFVNADRKQLIQQDMAHFSRMGFDAVRVCFWGDWENSDEKGNLIANDHLDLMDYLIAQAHQRGIYMLLSPIVTYSSLWPDLQDDPSVKGFSRHFQKSELGTNPEAIAAQQNYLIQLLNHVNPYTGVALKDEPNILFIEMINEPWHHSDDYAGSIKYINALVNAVRSTGCQKPTFHNISQDFGMARAIHDSEVDGSSFAWYPSGLNFGHELHGNFLRFIDDYPHMTEPLLSSKPKIVYEFDMPDVISGYHYPAMARTFRQAGAQQATMFSYDMLATAPYNLGWHTHLLNLVYTPKKAASAIIAGEVMRNLPRLGSYGSYPENTHFGDFRVSYEQDLGEMVTAEKFMYSNNTDTFPPSAKSLKRIVGFGSSPIVKYEGQGIYFLDRIDSGRWRLEVYPDSIQVNDPFHDPKLDKICFQLVARSASMTIALPDLGDDFKVEPLNQTNSFKAQATKGTFVIKPGVYLLCGSTASDAPLPEKIANVGLREFVCPDAGATPLPNDIPSKQIEKKQSGELVLFQAERDADSFAQTRAGWAKPTLVTGGQPDAKAMMIGFPADAKSVPEDFSRSMFVGDRIAGRAATIKQVKSIAISLKGHTNGSLLHLVLVAKDGAAWGAAIQTPADWQTIAIPINELKPTKWAMLPQAYPNGMSYWASKEDEAEPNLGEVERLQLSLRKSDVGQQSAREFGADVQSVSLRFDPQ
jgi:Cellulase (glycosyl hydrolase family 5)